MHVACCNLRNLSKFANQCVSVMLVRQVFAYVNEAKIESAGVFTFLWTTTFSIGLLVWAWKCEMKNGG